MINTSIYAQPMVRITTYLTQTQDSVIASLASTTGKTKADIIREAIDQYKEKSDSEVEDIIKGFQNGFTPRNKTSFNKFLTLLKPNTPKYLNELASTLNDFSRTVMCIPRQMGATTTLTALALFKANTPNTRIIYGLPKGGMISHTMDMFSEQIQIALDSGQISNISSKTKSRIEFGNGSLISIENMSTDSFFNMMRCNKSNTTYILDGFAFIKDDNGIAAETVIDVMHTPGSRVYVSSTTNGMHVIDKQTYKPRLQCFYELWLFAKQYASPARAVFVNWDSAPGRDASFEHALVASMGEDLFQREFKCEFFDTNENTFIQVIGGGVE